MIYAILIGALCGWIASMIMGTNESMGGLANIVAGLIGGAIGGGVLGIIGLVPKDNLVGNLVSGVVGACIVIFVVKVIRGKR